MAKLDWNKASLREADPARAQRVTDFVEPDREVVRNLTPEEIRVAAKERKEARARRAAAAAAKRETKVSAARPKKSNPQPRRQPSEAEKHLVTERLKLAKAERQRQYLAKAERERAAMADKKKTHLEAWAEQVGVRVNQRELRGIWRASLLPKASGE